MEFHFLSQLKALEELSAQYNLVTISPSLYDSSVLNGSCIALFSCTSMLVGSNCSLVHVCRVWRASIKFIFTSQGINQFLQQGGGGEEWEENGKPRVGPGPNSNAIVKCKYANPLLVYDRIGRCSVEPQELWSGEIPMINQTMLALNNLYRRRLMSSRVVHWILSPSSTRCCFVWAQRNRKCKIISI